MKIRNGFVSNSSSSSYLILGTYNPEVITKLVESEKIMCYDSSGITKENELTYIGSNGLYIYSPSGKRVSVDDDEEGFIDPEYVGLEIEDRLEDTTLAELRTEFKEIVKRKINIDVQDKDIKLHYGEIDTG